MSRNIVTGAGVNEEGSRQVGGILEGVCLSGMIRHTREVCSSARCGEDINTNIFSPFSKEIFLPTSNLQDEVSWRNK